MIGRPLKAAPLVLHGRLCEHAARRFPWLYLVTDTSTPERQARFFDAQNHADKREPFYTHLYKCLEGGVDMLQYKDDAVSDAEYRQAALRIQIIAQRFDVPLIIRDRVDVALDLGAWLHVTRKSCPPEKLKDIRAEFDKKNLRQCVIGYSIDVENVNEGPYPQDADLYVAGPVFGSATRSAHPTSTTLLGIDGLELANRTSDGDPIVAVGGITRENVCDVMACGVAGVCVESEMMDSKNPTAVGRELKDLMRRSISGKVPKAKEGRTITEILNARTTMQMGFPGSDKKPRHVTDPGKNI